MNSNQDNNKHEGHRQRLKKRFLENGIDTFEPHNILELILFYSIPRRDTNEIAHSLIEKFGSFKEVCEADFEELLTVKGINENSATLIKLIPQLSKYYLNAQYQKRLILDDASKIGSFLVTQYIGETKEIVYMLLLDNKMGLIKNVRLHDGTLNSAQISIRKIFDEVTKYKASAVVLAHNHPNGLLIPSTDDIYSTTSLFNSLESMEIPLLEHFLIAGDRFLPIIKETPSLYNLRENSELCNIENSKVAQMISYNEKELDILAGRIRLDKNQS